LSAANICVKPPGDEPEDEPSDEPADEGAAGAADGCGSWLNGLSVPLGAGVSPFLSRATWTNALASSRDAFMVPGAPEELEAPGVLSACSMRVKSPGAFAGGAVETPGGGVVGFGFENTGADGDGVGVEKTGAGVGSGGAGAGLENAAGTGAGGEVGFSLSALNICVKLPGEDEPDDDEPGEDGALGAAGGGTGSAGANAAGADAGGVEVAGAEDGFSLRVPNICVKLPGEDEPEEDEAGDDEGGE
jgi:hypothetical protein